MLILPDKRCLLPTDIVVCELLTSGQSNPDNPLESVHTLKSGHFICARRENKRWTRQKRFSVRCVGESSELLRKFPAFSRPTYLFSLRLMQTLAVGGFWGLLESGSFVLSRTKTLSPVPSLRRKQRESGSDVQTGLVIENGPTAAVVAWTQQGAKLIATDVRNYLDVTPKKLAACCGTEWPGLPDEDSPYRQWENVAVDRAIIVYRVITDLIDWWCDTGLGTWGLTAGSCALASFRNFPTDRHIDTPDDEECRDFERLAYFGGLIECKWVGKKTGSKYTPHPHCLKRPDLFHNAPQGNLHLVDASSFYGSIQIEHDLPIKLTHVVESLQSHEWQRIINDETYLAEIRIETGGSRFPVRVDQRTMYPTGTYTTVLCGPELLHAVATGTVRGVGRLHRYVCVNQFRLWTERLYSERIGSKSTASYAVECFVKQLIASLHGKFAQRRTQWEVCPDEPCLEPWGSWSHYSRKLQRWVDYRAIGNQVQMEVDGGDASHCFPAIAAFTTAYGRQTMRMYEQIAGASNVLYINTDAMIVTDDGLRRLDMAGLVDDNRIGALRVKASSPDIEMRGAGCFSFAGKLWLSGINRSEHELIFGTVHHQSCEGLAGIIAHKGRPVIRVLTHEISPGWYYDPLRTDDDGWITPPHLNESSQSWLTARKTGLTY